MSKRIEDSIESKFIQNREGSSCRTSDEIAEVLISDACAILKIAEPEIDDTDTNEDYSDLLTDTMYCYQGKLESAGYTVIFNDGYCIYKDLTDEEAEYIYA